MKISIPLTISGSQISIERERPHLARIIVKNGITQTDASLNAKGVEDLITALQAMKLATA